MSAYDFSYFSLPAQTNAGVVENVTLPYTYDGGKRLVTYDEWVGESTSARCNQLASWCVPTHKKKSYCTEHSEVYGVKCSKCNIGKTISWDELLPQYCTIDFNATIRTVKDFELEVKCVSNSTCANIFGNASFNDKQILLKTPLNAVSFTPSPLVAKYYRRTVLYHTPLGRETAVGAPGSSLLWIGCSREGTCEGISNGV